MSICAQHPTFLYKIPSTILGANSSGSKRAKRSGFFTHKKLKHVGMEDLLAGSSGGSGGSGR